MKKNSIFTTLTAQILALTLLAACSFQCRADEGYLQHLFNRLFGPSEEQKALDEKQTRLNNQLVVAANHGEIEKVRQCLEQGANVNAQHSYHGGTALFWASAHGHEDIVELLLDYNADVNAEDTGGGTALMNAAAIGSKEIVELLLDRGADVNAQSTGYTALMLACSYAFKGSERKNKETVELLLQRGADVNVKDRWGDTALDRALGDKDMDPEIANLLRHKGAIRGKAL